ncbi:hypothetical protein [Kribbella italica]|uniref:Uncharacterized protein n=1 Tax=Kribbella italica TaxID=1540520 RepID=A0A7W9MVB6_9ACTN|nr:hypothetical protein [Kribbella italica]MBB5837751.1 hypothetical protein [Kribbella italica]
MAAPAGAYVLKDALFTVEATDYANQATSVMLTPEQATQTLRTLVPDGVVQDVDTATWTCAINGIQDYVAAQGLARLLTDMAGQQIDIVFEPKKGGVSATVTVVAKAVPFGGPQGQFTTFDVELPVVGAPVFGDPI